MNEYIEELEKENFGISRLTFLKKFYDFFKKSNKYIRVLETGCNYNGGAGYTNCIAHILSHYLKGEITTIDINFDHITKCQNKFSTLYNNVNYICGDSVKVIESLSDEYIKSIDLFILDSYDLNIFHPHNSANHHLKELLTFINRINEKALIAIDDNFLPNTDIYWTWNNGNSETLSTNDKTIGKGVYCDTYLKNIGWNRDESILYAGANNVFLYKKNV